MKKGVEACNGVVISPNGVSRPCKHSGHLMFENKAYCQLHDPDYIRVKAQKRKLDYDIALQRRLLGSYATVMLAHMKEMTRTESMMFGNPARVKAFKAAADFLKEIA